MEYECFSCTAKFSVDFEDEDFSVKHCPFCGEEIDNEIEMVYDISEDDPDLD